jgi:hypothetical protein
MATVKSSTFVTLGLFRTEAPASITATVTPGSSERRFATVSPQTPPPIIIRRTRRQLKKGDCGEDQTRPDTWNHRDYVGPRKRKTTKQNSENCLRKDSKSKTSQKGERDRKLPKYGNLVSVRYLVAKGYSLPTHWFTRTIPELGT